VIFLIIFDFIYPQSQFDDNFGLLAISIIIILSSIIIETLRATNKSLLFGFYFTKRTSSEILIGIVIAVLPFILLLIYFYSTGMFNPKNALNFNDLSVYINFIFLTALIEELLFRGIIFQAIGERFGYVFTIVISGLIFAIGHCSNPHSNIISFINTFIAGILLGLMFWKTKSLYLPIIYHFCWNFSQSYLINSPVSGYIFDIGLIEIKYEELNSILFGTNYGFESGLLATLIMILSIIVVLKYMTTSPLISSKIWLRKIEESNYF
jgi:hypothetical protein